MGARGGHRLVTSTPRRNRDVETVKGYGEAVGVSISQEEAESLAPDVLHSLEPVRQLWATLTIPDWLKSWRDARRGRE